MSIASYSEQDQTLEIAFDDNRLVIQLCGEFDQNLALIEQRLGIHAAPRGNHIVLSGSACAVEKAQIILQGLYNRLLRGEQIDQGDVDGLLRISDQSEQLSLPSFETCASVRMAQISTRKATIMARTRTQDAYIRALERHEMIFAFGPAGTGKTYLAVAFAAALLERGEIDRVILTRPAVEAGERLGFLPGDMKEKVDPYLRPLYDALHDMTRPEYVERALQSGAIEVAPLAFMRGRTLSHAMVILDEAQNTTQMQMKMFLTRLGEHSKMIINGDPSQIDLPHGQKSGLVEALGLLKDVEGICQIHFTSKDVVRHELVSRIIKAYNCKGSAS